MTARTWVSCLVVLSCLLGSTALAGLPTYDIQELEALPGLFPLTAVHDIANSGQSVGRTWKEEAVGVQNHHAVLWSDDGEPTDIGENGRWSEAYGISETGFIVGRHDVAAGMRGALWTGMVRQPLPPLPGQPASEAYDVDDSGIAVGASLISSTDATAVRWVNGNPQILPGANGMSRAAAVNGPGQAVGMRDIWPARHAMLWEGSNFTVLPHLGGNFAWATNINDEGTICGGGLDGSSELFSVLWEGPTHAITILPDPPFGAYTRVRDVNNLGIAVGEICLSIECNPGDQRALVWIDGGVHDLNTLIPPGTGWVLFSAEAINDAGEIVCIGANDGFVSPRGFKLTPRPTASVAGAPAHARTLTVFPNPMRGEGHISWATSVAGSATLDLYDVTGRWLAGRHFPHLAPGISRAGWSSLAGSGDFARGAYLLRLERADGSAEQARVLVVR